MLSAAAAKRRVILLVSGEPFRFAVAGGVTALVYFGGTLLLSGPVGLPIQLSILVAYATSLAVHFTMQRVLVFRDHDAFELAVHQQAGRYLTLAAIQYAFTATATAVLPSALGLSDQVVYVLSAGTAACVTFLVLRRHVFHPEER